MLESAQVIITVGYYNFTLIAVIIVRILRLREQKM